MPTNLADVNAALAKSSTASKTGGQAAREILDAAQIKGVLVTANVKGENYYDPARRLISLSLPVHYKSTFYAIAIAAHEVGHALQDDRGYIPFRIRVWLFPIARNAACILPFALLLCAITPSLHHSIFFVLWSYVALAAFHLLTLPIEIDASRRAHIVLLNSGLIRFGSKESEEVKVVLTSCCLTYAMAFLTAPVRLVKQAARLFATRR